MFPANLQSGDGSPAARSFACVKTPNVVLRLVELNEQHTEAVVELDPAFAAGLSRAALVDLMEQPAVATSGGPAPAFDGRTLRAPVRAHSFVSVRLS